MIGSSGRTGKRPGGIALSLPVPLWGEITHTDRQNASAHADELEEGGSRDAHDARRRRARRRNYDQSQRDDPLVLNRFEKILTWSEMINVNRARG